jgi:hypothetical protein
VAADGEALDRGDPQLLDRILLGRRIGQREAAVELVDQAEVAQDVPEEADLALVEVREVDAGAEQALARVLGVRDGVAAQHADLGLRVEQREVDRGLQAGDRGLVLGVQVARDCAS